MALLSWPYKLFHAAEVFMLVGRDKLARNPSLTLAEAKTVMRPLEEIIAHAPQANDNFLRTRSYAAARLFRKPKELKAVVETLAAEGIEKVTLFKEGSYALVLDCGNGEVARIAHQKSEFERINAKSVVQPRKRLAAGKYRIELIEKLDPENVTAADLKTLRQRMKEEGLKFSDPSAHVDKGLRDNVAKSKDGNVYITDGDFVERKRNWTKLLRSKEQTPYTGRQ